MIMLCPHCNKKLNIADELAGHDRTCPACHKAIKIPGLATGSAAAPSAQSHASPPRTPAPPVRELRDEPAIPAPPPPRPGARPQPAGTPLGVGSRDASSAPYGGPGGHGPTAQGPGTGSTAAASSPVTRLAGADGISRVMASLVAAMSPRKLGFFLASSAIFLPFYILLSIAATYVFWALPYSIGPLLCMLIMAIYYGLFNVQVGGIAYLAHTEALGRQAGIGGTIVFCCRKFLPLFCSAGILALVLVVVAGVLNWLIMLLNGNQGVGSFVAALLFLPQMAINLGVALTLWVAVVAPCTVVVEGAGALQAVLRLVHCVRRQGSQLIVHAAVTTLFLVLVFTVLAWLAAAGMVPTMLTNSPGGSVAGMLLGGDNPFAEPAPSPAAGLGMFNLEGQADQAGPSKLGLGGKANNPFAHDAGTPSGDWLRWFGIVLVLAVLLAYPTVFWIVSFTRYCESLPPQAPAARPPAAHAGAVR